MNVEATLTRAEIAKPFRETEPDSDPIVGPTRLALEIEDLGDCFRFVDRCAETGVEVERVLMPKDNH